MHMAMGTRGGRRTLAVIAGLVGVFLAARAIAAPAPATATDISPSTVKADSLQVPVFGIDLTGSGQSLSGARVEFANVAGFTAADLERDIGCDDGDLTTCDGVQIWRDTSTSELDDDTLDDGDTPLSSGFAFDGDCATLDYLPPDTVCAATLTMQPSAVPAVSEGAYTHFIAIRTSGTLTDGDRFEVALQPDALTTSPVETTTVSATTRVITADLTAPNEPVVDGLGLSKAIGIVRAGDTSVSSEEHASLQLWRSSEATCQGSLSKVAESLVGDLSEPHTDLIGVTAAQAGRVRDFPAGSPTVCYRIADEAGNLSGFTPDGRVPEAPEAADVALLSTSNLTDLKRVEAAPDPNGRRTFRLYLRPAGGSLERARTSDPLPARFVELTTATAAPTNSNTTDIRRWNLLSSLTAGDGIAYTRVNAAGNDSEATNDGSIPAAPATSDLGLLSTSAVENNQRVLAASDPAGARAFRLYGDSTGLGDWIPASTPTQQPVLVTTGAVPTHSNTTRILLGIDDLGSGATVGFTAISAHGNGSDVSADGSIPAAPNAAATSFSDATNSFKVVPFPLADGVGIRLFAGSTGSLAYVSGPEGEATSMTPVSVDELDAGLGLFYSAVHTASGNESPMTADGTIPPLPASDDLGVLATSAATGHQRVIADPAENPGRTFRLYGDQNGGRLWQPASSLAQAAVPVDITTGAARTDSNDPASTSSIYLGATQLGSGHAVGFSRVLEGNDSDVVADGSIPAAPIPAFMSVSDALDQMTATSATTASRVNLHVGAPSATAALAYDEAGPDAAAQSSAPVAVTDPMAGQTLWYTVLDAPSGNESPTVADGTVPVAPAQAEMSLLGASAAQGHQRVTSALDPSGPRILRVYIDPSGSGWVRATDGNGSLVELPTAVAVATSTSTSTIMAGGDQLAAGHVVGYARRTTEGNDSDVTTDGAIPASPTVSTLSASAASDTAKASGVDAATQMRVFATRSSSASVAYGEGSDASLTPAFTSRPVDLSAGDRLFYTVVSDATGNESAIASDGQIPAAPDAGPTSVSDARDEFVIPQAANDNRVNIFLDASGTPSVGYGDGADYSNITASPFAPGGDLPAQYVYYTAVDAGSGNESTILADGYIPAAPTDASAVMSASAARRRIASNPDASARRLRLWIDPNGAGVWRMAAANADGSGTVEVLTSTVQEILSPEGVFVSGQPLGAGMNVGYARLVSGNESDVAADGLIPAAPQNASHFSADANAGAATVAALAPTGTYRVFGGTEPASARTLHTTGLATTIPVDGLDEGDVVGYARTEGGNESPALADGTIPDAPELAVQSASDTGSSNGDGITSDNTPTIEARTAPAAQVTVFESASSLGTGTADGSGVASITLPARADGPHTLTAISTLGGNTSPVSGGVGITIDTSAPAVPGVPVLATSSDTGRSAADGITADATPAFSVGAEAGAVVTLLDGGSSIGSATASAAGTATPQAGVLGDGSHTIAARATDTAGNSSGTSAPVTITIDTEAPDAPARPDLLASSDTGASQTDDLTMDSTPSLRIEEIEPGSAVSLLESGATRASGIADADALTLTSFPLADGPHTFTATSTDVAGNISAASTPIDVRIDTAATALAAPQLDEASDTGVSASDGITYADEVTVRAAGAEQDATIRLMTNGIELAAGSASPDGDAAFVLELGEGTHDLSAQQIDAAGNTSAMSPAGRVVVDIEAPSGTIQPPSSIDGLASVSFDERVAGVTEDNFVMRQEGSSSTIASVVSLAADGRRATLRPAGALRPGTAYTLELAPEGAESPTDLAGNAVAGASTRFVTAQSAASPWSRVSASRAYGGSYVRQNVVGASAAYEFTGGTITFYTVKSSNGGYARVLIDGQHVTTLNTYSRTMAYKSATTFNNLGAGSHTIQIVVGSGRPQGSIGTWVAVDAFKVGSSLDATPRLAYGTASSTARRR